MKVVEDPSWIQKQFNEIKARVATEMVDEVKQQNPDMEKALALAAMVHDAVAFCKDSVALQASVGAAIGGSAVSALVYAKTESPSDTLFCGAIASAIVPFFGFMVKSLVERSRVEESNEDDPELFADFKIDEKTRLSLVSCFTGVSGLALAGALAYKIFNIIKGIEHEAGKKEVKSKSAFGVICDILMSSAALVGLVGIAIDVDLIANVIRVTTGISKALESVARIPSFIEDLTKEETPYHFSEEKVTQRKVEADRFHSSLKASMDLANDGLIDIVCLEIPFACFRGTPQLASHGAPTWWYIDEVMFTSWKKLFVDCCFLTREDVIPAILCEDGVKHKEKHVYAVVPIVKPPSNTPISKLEQLKVDVCDAVSKLGDEVTYGRVAFCATFVAGIAAIGGAAYFIDSAIREHLSEPTLEELRVPENKIPAGFRKAIEAPATVSEAIQEVKDKVNDPFGVTTPHTFSQAVFNKEKEESVLPKNKDEIFVFGSESNLDFDEDFLIPPPLFTPQVPLEEEKDYFFLALHAQLHEPHHSQNKSTRGDRIRANFQRYNATADYKDNVAGRREIRNARSDQDREDIFKGMTKTEKQQLGKAWKEYYGWRDAERELDVNGNQFNPVVSQRMDQVRSKLEEVKLRIQLMYGMVDAHPAFNQAETCDCPHCPKHHPAKTESSQARPESPSIPVENSTNIAGQIQHVPTLKPKGKEEEAAPSAAPLRDYLKTLPREHTCGTCGLKETALGKWKNGFHCTKCRVSYRKDHPKEQPAKKQQAPKQQKAAQKAAPKRENVLPSKDCVECKEPLTQWVVEKGFDKCSTCHKKKSLPVPKTPVDAKAQPDQQKPKYSPEERKAFRLRQQAAKKQRSEASKKGKQQREAASLNKSSLCDGPEHRALVNLYNPTAKHPEGFFGCLIKARIDGKKYLVINEHQLLKDTSICDEKGEKRLIYSTDLEKKWEKFRSMPSNDSIWRLPIQCLPFALSADNYVTLGACGKAEGVYNLYGRSPADMKNTICPTNGLLNDGVITHSASTVPNSCGSFLWDASRQCAVGIHNSTWGPNLHGGNNQAIAFF
jgi:hypothetical protein